MNRRRVAYRMADLFGLNRAARMAHRRHLLVLGYHGVCRDATPDAADPAGMHVPAKLFERQIELLLEHYRPVSLAAVRGAAMNGTRLPPRAVLITFDDGFRNIGRNALPLLERLGVPATLFVVAGAVERRSWLWPSVVEEHCVVHPEHEPMKRQLDRLPAEERRQWIADNVGPIPPREGDHSLFDWDELREIARMPHVTIGSHCLTHEPLATCSQAEATRELGEARELLRTRLDLPIDSLAYPHGSYTDAVVDAAAKAGYSVAFTTDPHHAAGIDDPLRIPRILVGRGDDRVTLAARTAGWQEWIRPALTRLAELRAS